MTELDLERLLARRDVARWGIVLARWIESSRVQHVVTAVILLNAVVLGLESWSMGIVRPVMEQHAWAWAFLIPFIVIATFTILNLFVGIIVSTMQELAAMPEPGAPQADVVQSLARIEQEVRELRVRLEETARST
jgi:hypothetical protein